MIEESDVEPGIVGRALLSANRVDPGEIVSALHTQFARSLGAIDLRMHLIDYRMLQLRPVQPHGTPALLHPESVLDSELGAAYRLQEPTGERVPAGYLHHVPISVRGQRLGVLTGTFRQEPAVGQQRGLRSLALVIAHAMLEAGPGTDVFELGRRHGRMSVAAEMQWQLLPARAYRTSHFYVAGHLEPALRVAGDAFDFAVNDHVLTLTVVDATSTEGAPSLVTTLVVTALRNARRSRLPLQDQAALASDIVWQHSRGREHAAALLMQLDAVTGRATAVDAGSPAVLRMREGRLEPLTLDAQTPLGMFSDTDYREEIVDLRAGDRTYLLTDGAFAENRTMQHVVDVLSGEEYAGYLPPESIRRLTAALTDDGQEPEDDITVMCVDWMN